MSTAEDEPLIGLNGRLRPRKSNGPSPVTTKIVKKTDGKSAQEKTKKNSTPKVSTNKPLDLPNKSDLLCPFCDKKFTSKQTLSKHARRLHDNNFKQITPIECLHCNHTETEANEIIRHMVDSHPNQYFACLDCHSRFLSTSELAEHKLNTCEKQKQAYRTKLRQKKPERFRRNQKALDASNEVFQKDKEFQTGHGFNGIVISCEPSRVLEGADIEDNITTNLILPPTKSLSTCSVLDKNAIIVLDDIQWNKRIPSNFSFHSTDADQILSRLGVVHRARRTEEHPRRDCYKIIDDPNQKFERCFDTSFYSKVASNVQENLMKYLDGSFNFNPDPENIIKTRKSKNSVIINTAEGFPILLAYEQYCRNDSDGYMPRAIAPRHKWKWENLESDRNLTNPDQIKRDAHTHNCIITLVSSLDIWTQLCMRRKYEEKYNSVPVEKKTEHLNIIGKELKEILESRAIPTTSSLTVKRSKKPLQIKESQDFPATLGLVPTIPNYNLQPAVLSGEWVRPRCYVCCACGAQNRDSRGLSSHITSQHPNAQVQHYEIAGELLLNAEILKHLYVPPAPLCNRTRPLRGIRECTKCKKSVSLEELHQHMLDCAGDTPAIRRKCRYRPFGVRKRRTRLPDNTIRKKIRKDIRTRQARRKSHIRRRPKIRSEVGDAETIRKMIADLPAKRHRVMINPTSSILRPRTKLDKQRKFLLKRRPSEDVKSKKLRSRRIINKMAQQDPPSQQDQPNTVMKNDDKDEDTKPFRSKRVVKKGISKKEILKLKVKRTKNKTVLMKQQVAKETISEVISELSGVAECSSNIEIDQLSIDNGPDKIDVSGEPYNTRQSADRRGNNNNRDRPLQPGPSGHNENVNNSFAPAPNVPLKHSIARLTANSETHDKSVQFHHLFLVQQECNNVNQHLPSVRRMFFENEAVVTRLDKPPLHFQRAPLDSQAYKNKLNKPKKKLNDCIAMLKNKLDTGSVVSSGNISVQCGGDEPLYSDSMMSQQAVYNFSPKTNFISSKGNEMCPQQNRQSLEQQLLESQTYTSHACTEPNDVYTYSKHFPDDMQDSIGLQQDNPSKVLEEKKIPPVVPQPYPVSPCEVSVKRKSARQKTAALKSAQANASHTTANSPKKRLEITPQIDIILKKSNLPQTSTFKPKLSKTSSNSETNKKKQNTTLNKNVQNMSSSAQINHEKVKRSPKARMTRNFHEPRDHQKNLSEPALENPPTETKDISGIKEMFPISNINIEQQKDTDLQVNLQRQCTSELYTESFSNIPPAHASTSVNSYLSGPLDLSGKSVIAIEECASDGNYIESYDSCETLDLSNKNADILSNFEVFNDPDVVDLSFKPNQNITQISNSNLFIGNEEQYYNLVTDLSIKNHDYAVPTDLSVNVNRDLSPKQNVAVNYVQDLSAPKLKTAYSEHKAKIMCHAKVAALPEIVVTKSNILLQKESNILLQKESSEKHDDHSRSSDLIIYTTNVNVETPTDLSLKTNVNISKETDKPQDVYEDAEDNINSQIPLQEEHNCQTENNTMEQINEHSPEPKQNMTYDSPLKILQHQINVNITKSRDINDKSTSDIIISNSQIQSDVHILPKIPAYTDCESNISQGKNYQVSNMNISSMGSLHISTLSTHNLATSSGRKENTTPVYTLSKACISITKIGTSSSTTLTNTLLSIPSTTITNTTSVYTLAGSSVGVPINYGGISKLTTLSSETYCHGITKNNDLVRTSPYNQSDDLKSINDNVTNEDCGQVTIVNKYEKDPEIKEKISKLPQDLANILEKMPIDHRKQLLEVLPQYVNTSQNIVNQNELHLKKSLEIESNTTTCQEVSESTSNDEFSKRPSYIYHSSAVSCNKAAEDSNLAGSLPSFVPNLEEIDSSFLSKCQHKIVLEKHTEQGDLNESISESNKSLLKVDEPESQDRVEEHLSRIIDLTDEENIATNTDMSKGSLDSTKIYDKSSVVTVRANKKKMSSVQTASLRAVRIKAPSERKKSISKEVMLVNKPSIDRRTLEPSNENKNSDDVNNLLLKNKALAIQQAEISSTQHTKNISLKLTNDLSTAESAVIIAGTKNTHTQSKTKDENNTVVIRNFVSSSIVTKNILNDPPDKNNVTANNFENTTREKIFTQKNVLISNESDNTLHLAKSSPPHINKANENQLCTQEDDSDDDISLAVIVKQKQIEQKKSKSNLRKEPEIIKDGKEHIQKAKKQKQNKNSKKLKNSILKTTEPGDGNNIDFNYVDNTNSSTNKLTLIDQPLENDCNKNRKMFSVTSKCEPKSAPTIKDSSTNDKSEIEAETKDEIVDIPIKTDNAERHPETLDSSIETIQTSLEMPNKKLKHKQANTNINASLFKDKKEKLVRETHSTIIIKDVASHGKKRKQLKSLLNKGSVKRLSKNTEPNIIESTVLKNSDKIKHDDPYSLEEFNDSKSVQSSVSNDTANKSNIRLKKIKPKRTTKSKKDDNLKSITSKLKCEKEPAIYSRLSVRRSRRVKSLIEENSHCENVDEKQPEEVVESVRVPITKKQRIFSKLLHDEKISKLSTNTSTGAEINTILDTSESAAALPVDNLYLGIKDKNKSQKRKKKLLPKGKKIKSVIELKRKKILNKEISAQNINCKEISLMDFNVSDNKKLEASYHKECINKKENSEAEATVSTESTTSDVIIDIDEVKEKLIKDHNFGNMSSAEKRKIELCDNPNFDQYLYEVKTKKSKLDNLTNEEDINKLEEVKDLNNHNKTESDKVPEIVATTCYNTVAAKRPRSKSMIIQSSDVPSYDPYDIDLEEMNEKDKECSQMKTLTNFKMYKCQSNPTKAICTTSSKLSSSDKQDMIQEPTTPLKSQGDENCDSDDSSKSDVPLKKYVEEKEKNSELETILNQNKLSGLSSENVNGILNEPNCAKETQKCNDMQHETDEQLRSEQFMESFGFFSERKPRKSNLLASKKISETFNIIASESDDAYFGNKEREHKKILQCENKNLLDFESEAKTSDDPSDRKLVKRGRKKKNKTIIEPTSCMLCKKEFRRADNYLRHLMTLLHISKLSEVEMKVKTIPVLEEPNYLIAYKQQLDRLKVLTIKLAKQKKKSKSGPKIVLPTMEQIIADVNKTMREQQLSQRGLSRDEALFLDCCELLKESHKSEVQPLEGPNRNNLNNIGDPQPSASGLNVMINVSNDDKCDTKSDGDVDSITAKNILESEEVRNLENDLISGLKEAAQANNLNLNNFEYNVSHISVPQTLEQETEYFSSRNMANESYDRADSYDIEDKNNCSAKKNPEFKEKMYPDVEVVDMFEDKFDKIKRKSRSQAAAAKQMQAIVKPSTRHKERKKSDAKKGRKCSKKNFHSIVRTKGALKGFDGIKVSIPTADINISAIVPSHECTRKRKKKSGSKKKFEKMDVDNRPMYESDNGVIFTHKKVDVYEFMDNDDAELFEFRPSTLMERFKSLSNKDMPSTSKTNFMMDQVDNSSTSASDGDDFVYMSDDYVASDNETENSRMSFENSTIKGSAESKKIITPQKRKDVVEKNAVMGRIFKNNAVRSDKKNSKSKDFVNPKANLDQLFDSLLEDEPNSSIIEEKEDSPKKDDSLFRARCEGSLCRTRESSPSLSIDNETKTLLEKGTYSSPKSFDSANSTLLSLSNKYDSSPSKESEISSLSKKYNKPIKKSEGSSFNNYDTESEYGPSTSKPCKLLPKDFIKHDTATVTECLLPKYRKTIVAETCDIEKEMKNSSGGTSLQNQILNVHESENCNSLTELIKQAVEDCEDTGVARQRARRKCTVGKQNVLAETWSSESEPDRGPMRPNSAESVVLGSGRRKRGRKRDANFGSRRGSRHESRVNSSSRNMSASRGSGAATSREKEMGEVNVSAGPSGVDESLEPEAGPSSGLKGRPRPATYYNWSSDGDDEQEHLQQHGWIVGDSHKKLVTMLAHAKGRKRNNDDKRHYVE